MTTSSNKTKIGFFARCTSLAEGIIALPDSSFVLGGMTQTKTQAVAPLQVYTAAVDDTAAKKTAYDKALQTERAARPVAVAQVDLLVPMLEGRYGKKAPELESLFGLPPPKTPKKSALTKATAVVKADATRKARGTAGPNQKKAVKGRVTATLVVTPEVPAPVAPSEVVPAAALAPATTPGTTKG